MLWDPKRDQPKTEQEAIELIQKEIAQLPEDMRKDFEQCKEWARQRLPSLDGFRAFVAKQIANGKDAYEWRMPDQCPVGCYLYDLGLYFHNWDDERGPVLTQLVLIARGPTKQARKRRWRYKALQKRLGTGEMKGVRNGYACKTETFYEW